MKFTVICRMVFVSTFVIFALIGIFSKPAGRVYVPVSDGVAVISTAIDMRNYSDVGKGADSSADSVYTFGNDKYFPENSAQACAVVCADNGEVLYLKNGDTPLPMASTTKIMTALVAIELLSPEATVSVAPDACGVEGSSIYLAPNENLSVLDLLYGLLLESGNDAATALAIAACSDVASFVDAMNRKASLLGLTLTHFDNPHGLSSETHRTTARELALITYHAMKNPLFRSIVSSENYTVFDSNGVAVKYFSNHNKLLRTYDGASGVKTGYTIASGRCLVTSAKRNGTEFIVVTLNDRNDFSDHKRLLDYAFSAYESITFAEEKELSFHIGGRVLSNSGAVSVLTEKNHSDTFSADVIVA